VNTLSAASLDPAKYKRPKEPHSLVILNACESAAYDPELIYGFLGKLKLMGASGVVGTEVKVFIKFARPFGLLLLHDLLSGCTLGEAALNARRHFERQGNPLGMIYSIYAPANLHLHREGSCPTCQRTARGQAKP
jgi:hypothetical protein